MAKFKNINIDKLIKDRKKFDAFVYTPVNEAILELKRRREDKKLEKKILEFLNGDVPKPFLDGVKAVLFRQLSTPNYEIRRFISIIDGLDNNLKPCFWEYYDDKFTSNNDFKHSLGKMMFYFGRGKKGGEIIERINVIDFNNSNGKKISEVKTLWGQPLVEFHHELFNETDFLKGQIFFDASEWFRNNGHLANYYYVRFLSLFIRNGILFENFVLDKELDLLLEAVFPAFLEIYKNFGLKPLIVALEPTEIESDFFWNCHPYQTIDLVKNKLL